ncbi:uncharacterized protein LOC135846707 [Planococcus citri]|uniref:uncharacterized protein LOC135846707 n=1 Tax=Planococcus citri TaxID=170843 RepID=UPI0031F9052B
MKIDHDYEATCGPLVFHHKPGDLKKLAAMSLVAALMNHNITLMRKNKGHSNTYANGCEHDMVCAELPSSLLPVMKSLNHDMHRSRIKWWKYHSECVLSRRRYPDSIIDLLPLLVWLPDASISYEQTAGKILKCDKLPNKEKLRVACAYCFVDDVDRFKQTLTPEEIEDATKDDRYSGSVHPKEDLIVNYWNGKFSSILDYLFPMHERILDGVTSLKYYTNWSAVEYFWTQLDDEKRLNRALSMINYCDQPALTCHVLVKLSDSELDAVIARGGLQIIRTLVKEQKYFEFIISTWKRMVNVIDDQALVVIICSVNEFQDCSRCYLNSVLWEMWLCLSERQKKFIIDERVCDFTQNSYKATVDFYYRPNFRLIIDVLVRIDSESRRQYWLQHWPYLAPGQLDDESSINQIMQLCLANDEEIALFKRTEMLEYDSISDYAEYKLSHGYFKELQNYLEFCTSDLEVIRSMKKKMVTMMSKKALFFALFDKSPRIWNQFETFMNDIFTPNDFEKFMYKVMLDPDTLKEICNAVCETGDVHKVSSFVEEYLTSEKHLVKVKFEIYGRCFQSIEFSEFIERSTIADLTIWCFNGDTRLVERFNELHPSIDDDDDDGEEEEEEEREVKRAKVTKKSIYRHFCDAWLDEAYRSRSRSHLFYRRYDSDSVSDSE